MQSFSIAISQNLYGGSNFRKAGDLVGMCAVLPDADVLAFRFGIPYESVWGHRG